MIKQFQFPNDIDLLPKPYVWQTELTNRCSKTCLGCPRRYMTRPMGDMNFSTFRAVVEAVKEAQHFHRPMGLHHFGESLLHPELSSFIAFARKENVPTWLSVNPDHMSFEIAQEIIDAGLTRITFSLDGLDDIVLRTVRGSLVSFQRSHQGILDFIRARKLAGTDCQIRVQMIAYKHNQHQWKKFLEIWNDEDVFAYIKDFDTWTHPEFSDLGVKIMQNTCIFPFQSVVILWDGRIVPCCHDYNGELVMGSIHDNLERVWRGEKYRQLRDEFFHGLLTEDHLCRRCGWRQE